MHLPVLAHLLVWLENGNHQSRAKNHRLGKARHESEGQVQEEMQELKIINRSGQSIRSEMQFACLPGNRIPINPDCEHNYLCDRYLKTKAICLYLSPGRCIFLYNDFIDKNMIAYVRKGDGDHWFVDPIPRGAKLVRKHVCNSTPSQIAVAEFASERTGVTRRPPGSDDLAPWTAWWEIQIPSRMKGLLIVDHGAVVKKHRKYFGRGGGVPLVGNDTDVQVLRLQNNNVNIFEINMASHNEHVEVKEIPGGLLDLTSSWRPRFLV
jgi:hypothetical protein